jgi:hypothetical protein
MNRMGAGSRGRSNTVESAVDAAVAENSGQIVIAGAGYAGLHVALRLSSKLRSRPAVG